MKLIYFMIVAALASTAPAAEYKTKNFTVTAADAELARQVGNAAEYYRANHAREWIGQELPNWYAPCPITVKAGPNMPAGGLTAFQFDRGHVYGWKMEIQGTPQDLIDSTVPHEVLHTIFASHFRRPIPRWADEGAATYVESASDKQRQRLLAAQVMGTAEQYPIRELLTVKQYPRDGRRLAVLYAQGFFLSEFLIDRKGKPEFIGFLQTYFKTGDWDTAFIKHYGFDDQEAAATAAFYAARPITGALEVKMITRAGCIYCDKAKTTTLPALKARGVIVSMVDAAEAPEAVEGVPVFILYRDGKRVARLDGYQTAAQVMAGFPRNEPEAVQVAQGVGIGYFGPVGGDRSRANPHPDFSPAQTQLLNAAIDNRAGQKITQAISDNMRNLELVIDARIQGAILKIQSELTPEQKALINATEAQKGQLAALQQKIEVVEAGKTAFQKAAADDLARVQKENAELATQVDETKQETASIKTGIKNTVIAAVKEHAPAGLTGWVTFAYGAIQALLAGGPVGLAIYAGSRVIGRKEETATAAK